MTPEQWAQGLDLPNLVRYADIGTVRGLVTTAIREAVAEETERCAKMAETWGGHPPSPQGRRARLAAAIRSGK